MEWRLPVVELRLGLMLELGPRLLTLDGGLEGAPLWNTPGCKVSEGWTVNAGETWASAPQATCVMHYSVYEKAVVSYFGISQFKFCPRWSLFVLSE